MISVFGVYALSRPQELENTQDHSKNTLTSNTDNEVKKGSSQGPSIRERRKLRLLAKSSKLPQPRNFKNFYESPELIDMNEEIRISKLTTVPYKQEIGQWLKGRVSWLKQNNYDRLLRLLNSPGISPRLVDLMTYVVKHYIQDTKYLIPESPQREADLEESDKVLEYLKDLEKKPQALAKVRISK